MERSDLGSFLEEAFRVARSAGFTVNVISYPKDRRSIDLVGVRGEKRILVKIALNTKNLGKVEFGDLKRASRAYVASALIVSERDEDEALEDDLVVKMRGLNIISMELFKNYLLRRERPLVYKLRGNLLVRIDHVKFRELRMSHGYSIGELADKIGVSRKTVYEYERGQMNVTIDRAIRIAEVLGEEVFRPIDLLQDEEDRSEAEGRGERGSSAVSRAISELCAEVFGEECALYRLLKTPVDYVLRAGNRTLSIVLRSEDFSEKIDDALRIASTFNSKEIVVDKLRDLTKLKDEIK